MSPSSFLIESLKSQFIDPDVCVYIYSWCECVGISCLLSAGLSPNFSSFRCLHVEPRSPKRVPSNIFDKHFLLRVESLSYSLPVCHCSFIRGPPKWSCIASLCKIMGVPMQRSVSESPSILISLFAMPVFSVRSFEQFFAWLTFLSR